MSLGYIRSLSKSGKTFAKKLLQLGVVFDIYFYLFTVFQFESSFEKLIQPLFARVAIHHDIP